MDKTLRTVQWVGLAVVALLLLAGCAGHEHAQSVQPRANTAAPPPAAGPELPVCDPQAPMPAPGTCTLGSRNGQPTPDPRCTPGAINPAVSQATIKSTICQSGWTATIRPPSSKTGPMKAASARSYSLNPDQEGEYDHLVSLELGEPRTTRETSGSSRARSPTRKTPWRTS